MVQTCFGMDMLMEAHCHRIPTSSTCLASSRPKKISLTGNESSLHRARSTDWEFWRYQLRFDFCRGFGLAFRAEVLHDQKRAKGKELVPHFAVD